MTNDEIKKNHEGSLNTLWRIYVSAKPFYYNLYFAVSITLAAIFMILTCFSDKHFDEILSTVCDKGNAILPNLLGFNLGGYILIVGFGAEKILNVIIQPSEKNKKFSFYQVLISVLGVSVIVQILTLSMTFFVSTILNIELVQPFQNFIPTNPKLIAAINGSILFITSALITYSFLLLINVVKHVFLFAQTIHFILRLEKNTEETDITDEKK